MGSVELTLPGCGYNQKQLTKNFPSDKLSNVRFLRSPRFYLGECQLRKLGYISISHLMMDFPNYTRGFKMKKTIATITAVIVIGLLLLSGCTELEAKPKAAMFRANLQRTGVYKTKGVHQLTELKWKFKTKGGFSPSSPVIADGVAYFGSWDGNLYAVNIETGQQKWEFKTNNYWMYGQSEYIWMSSSPAIANGVVYVGSDDGYLYAVDIKTGQQKWEFQTGAVRSSPVIADGVVYLGSQDGNLYAVDIKTKQEKWKFETERSNYLPMRPGETDESKYKMSWPINSSPAISDVVIYFGSDDDYLYAVNIKAGQENWKFKTEGNVMSSPAIADGMVYFGSWDGHLYAVNTKTGQEKWKFRTKGKVLSSPAIADGVVYFGSNDGYLYAVNTKTGQEKWKFKTEGEVYFSPTVADRVVYFGSADGYLYAVR